MPPVAASAALAAALFVNEKLSQYQSARENLDRQQAELDAEREALRSQMASEISTLSSMLSIEDNSPTARRLQADFKELFADLGMRTLAG